MEQAELGTPELLAMVGEAKEPKAGPSVKGWPDLRNHYETRLAGMRNWRSSWVSHWVLLARFLLPRRSMWLTEGGISQPVANSMTRGLPINQEIVDPTGTQAMRICAAGMMSGLMGPSRNWFKMKCGVPGLVLDRDADLWFEQVEERIYAVMAGSNFYDSMAQMFEDLPTFGTAPILIYEDPKEIIRCFNPMVGEYYLSAGSSFRVEVFYRLFVLTISQIVEQFGIENCPEEIKSLWENKSASLESERIVAHAIEPNFPVTGAAGQDGVGVIRGGFTFREHYWLWGGQSERPLSERGFKGDDAPFIAPRWATSGNDPYGRSPGMDNLPDIMQLQVMTKRLAEAVEKMVRPPMLADIKLKNEPASILPGKVTYVDRLGPDTGMRPTYTVNPQVAEMEKWIQAIQLRIQKGFFNDRFMAISQMEGVQPRNEMELAERKAESMQVLGPVIEKVQTEAASPAIRRIFGIMQRRGLLPPVPKSLQGVPIKIDYVSMLTLAQKGAATASIERILSLAGRMEQAWPGTIDIINPDMTLREYGDDIAVPHKILRTDDEAGKIRAQKAQAAQKAQQGQQLQEAVPMATDAAHTLSQTDTGGGINALQLLLGTGGQQTPQ